MVAKGTRIEVIRNDLPRIAGEVDRDAEAAVRETTTFIHSEMAANAPIGPTGNLAGGNDMEVTRTADGWKGEVWNVMDYASYVNYGTGSRGASSPVPDRPAEITYTGSWLGMPARPFASQAAADAKPRFDQALRRIGQ